MKDSIFYSTLMTAFAFSVILLAAFDNSSVRPQIAMAEDEGVVVMEKTVVAASRLRLDATAGSDTGSVTSALR